MPESRWLQPVEYKGIVIDFERTYDYMPNLSWFVEATWRYSTRGKQQKIQGRDKAKTLQKVKKEIDKFIR